MLSGLFTETQTFRLHRAPTTDQHEDQEPRLRVAKQNASTGGELSPDHGPGTPFVCESSCVYLYQGHRQRHFICW